MCFSLSVARSGGQRAQDSALRSNRSFCETADISVQMNTITEGYPTPENPAATLRAYSSTSIKKLSQKKECQTFKSWP